MNEKSSFDKYGHWYLGIICLFVFSMYFLSIFENTMSKNTSSQPPVIVNISSEDLKDQEKISNIVEKAVKESSNNKLIETQQSNNKLTFKVNNPNSLTQKLQWIGAIVLIAFIAVIFMIAGAMELGGFLILIDLLLLLILVFC